MRPVGKPKRSPAKQQMQQCCEKDENLEMARKWKQEKVSSEWMCRAVSRPQNHCEKGVLATSAAYPLVNCRQQANENENNREKKTRKIKCSWQRERLLMLTLCPSRRCIIVVVSRTLQNQCKAILSIPVICITFFLSPFWVSASRFYMQLWHVLQFRNIHFEKLNLSRRRLRRWYLCVPCLLLAGNHNAKCP